MTRLQRVTSGTVKVASERHITSNVGENLDLGRVPAPNTVIGILTSAMTKLQQRDPGACELFASIASSYEFREAWLGLAVAHHLRVEPIAAAHALQHALSHHAVPRVPPLANSIAASVGAPGWCALEGDGNLTVNVVHPLLRGSDLEASVDGEVLLLMNTPDKLKFVGVMPTGWRNANELTVCAGSMPLLGSPIDLKSIARVEGFVDSDKGDLHGWAWCPNDHDRDPLLFVLPIAGGPGISIVADDSSINITGQLPLAQPRGFCIPATQLQCFNGLVRVCGLDGRDLIGSPIDPAGDRRNAAAASKIVACLFPAQGLPTRVDVEELRMPSVPAYVLGGPVKGGCKTRPVDIVVPVYGALDNTLACLESVLADLPRWAQVIVVDDASPDPRIRQKLKEVATHHSVTLLTNPVNCGFPTTANVGMRHDPRRDVVLLNSDTLVPRGWLARLRVAAYSAADVGTATPMSNDATILSYPSVDHPNKMLTKDETGEQDILAQKACTGYLVEIPTAIGFCVYIKRDCLNAVGLLREDVFAQGYGEENDFCIRARHLGWRHVAVPSIFVAHVGNQSFGSTKSYLAERNMRKLNQLHPGYEVLIRDFQSIDPLAEPRRRLDMERWKMFRSDRQSVLLITHGRTGGVQRHVIERANLLRSQGLRPVIISPVARRDGGGRDCVLANGPEGGTPNLRFAIPEELDLLTQLLRDDHPLRAEVHHLIGHHHGLLELFQRLKIPYEMVIHDYSWICPRINLVGANKHYCGEPDVVECGACIADVGSLNDEDTSPMALRQRSAIEMDSASRVVVPSEDVSQRVRRYFPSIQPTIVSWEDESGFKQSMPPPPAEGERRICVVGAIGIEKGYEVLLACARDAANRRLNLKFCLVGHSCDNTRLLSTGHVEITGHYNEHEAVQLIRKQHAHLAWLPSIWPETWCYTLTSAWQAGLNVLAFNIGTPAERIRRHGRGWLCPLGLSAQAINQLLLLKRHPLQRRGPGQSRSLDDREARRRESV